MTRHTCAGAAVRPRWRITDIDSNACSVLGGCPYDTATRRDPPAFCRRHCLPAARARRTDNPAYFAHLRRILALECTGVGDRGGWNAVFVWRDQRHPEPGASRTHRVPRFCFTSANAVHQQIWTAGYPEVVGLFDEIFVSSGTRTGAKPERRAFDTVAQRALASIRRQSCSST